MGTSICSVNYFCFGAVLIFVGSVLLCALGFTIVLPYGATRGWPQTTCHVINSSYHHHLCSCDRQPTFDLDEFDTCVGKYPCLQIYVWFKVVQKKPNETARAASLNALNGTSTDLFNQRIGRTRRSTGKVAETQTQNIAIEGEFVNTTVHPSRIAPAKFSSNVTSHFQSGNKSTISEETVGSEKREIAVTMGTDTLLKTMSSGKTISPSDSTAENKQPSATASNVETNNSEGYKTYRQLNDVTASNMVAEVSTEDSKGGKDVIYTGLLFRAWTDAFYQQCTLQECGDEQWNRQETRRYRVGWGLRGQGFPCFHHPNDPAMVILEKTPRDHMLHALIWPAVCLFIGCTLWLGLCFGCWSLETDSDESRIKHKYGPLK